MENKLSKKEEDFVAKFQGELIEHNERIICVGDKLMYSSFGLEIFEVLGLDKDEYGKFISVKRIVPESNEEADKNIRFDSLQYYRLLKNVSIEKCFEIAEKILSGTINYSDLEIKDTPTEQSTALMKIDENFYKVALEKSKEYEDKVQLVKAIVDAKVRAIKDKINGIISQHQKIITRLKSIVFTLKLYAGIDESILQIQSGTPSDDSEPIYLNQLMRFMDEEVGDPTNGGISYNNIEQFHDWLLAKNSYYKNYNYEFLLPQKKSVRIMRVRRNPSERYSSDVFENRWHIQQEMNTFILIRNGENIYFIDSTMQFNTKLYPDEKELTEIFKKSNGDEDKLYDKLSGYKNGMVLMQGLIDRTTVFGNLMGTINFLSTESQESGKVVFQYELDDDSLITDGSKTFLDFIDTSTIKAGDRIIAYRPYDKDRLYKLWNVNEYRLPQSPETDVYKVEEDKEYKCLYFKYLPDEKIYTAYDSHQRKNRVSYKIYPTDSNIVNFDIVSHRNIDWITNMLYDRRDRKKYLRSAGLLMCIKEFKTRELEEERPFMLMVASKTNKSELEVLDAIYWWKTKNKHKRALSVDDKKAFRMIVKHLNKNV